MLEARELAPVPEPLLGSKPGLPRWRRSFNRAAEPQIFFPAIALLVLAVIWGTTMNLLELERASAERTMTASAIELLDTYEAHVLRNLREIDHTLKVVKFAYEAGGDPGVLVALKKKGLLPPELLFAITIANRDGQVVASTRSPDLVYVGVDLYEHHLRTEELHMSRPRQDLRTGEWKLDFSRPLIARDRRFAGIVSLSVDAAYFVSDYERNKLGAQGLLGLVGSDDGIFRVRRTGEAIISGDAVRHPAFNVRQPEELTLARGEDGWDGVDRVSTLRQIHAFPVALVVGLSRNEQLAPVRANEGAYVLRAVIASVLLLLLIGGVGRMSWKLAQTARRENEANLAHAERIHDLAYRDALTNLPNRAFFSNTLEQSINQARRYGRTLAVLFLDLDRFKQINDTLGHQAGDRFLREVARRLQLCLRETDTVARFGGDEFVVLLPECEEQKYVDTVAQKLLAEVAQPFPLLDQSVTGTASIGIAIYPRDGHDEQTLMKYADAAMYHAKDQGKNNFQYYSSRLQANSLNRLRLETSLRLALERGELELHYQPKVDLETNLMTGMEALMRWESGEHGPVSPVDFIPIAEETGLIAPLGRWALETACVHNAMWQKQGLSGVCVAVNLSARQFTDDRLLDDVRLVLEKTGLDPRFLELEITESMLMLNVRKAIRTLSALSEMQVRLAIDDFGTGYSSLSNLKRFPLNTLKIDRSFISALPNDVEDRVITNAIVGMAKALSLTVVAEGVETQDQADYLRKQGCDEYQGYYFSQPVPADDFAGLLRAQAACGLSVIPVQRPVRSLPLLAERRRKNQQQGKP